jgi:hypothetical protein
MKSWADCFIELRERAESATTVRELEQLNVWIDVEHNARRKLPLCQQWMHAEICSLRQIIDRQLWRFVTSDTRLPPKQRKRPE